MPFELSASALVVNYRLDRLVGSGGMGVVWAATHVETGERVAIKFLKSAEIDGASRARFVREARATRLVAHPSVVSVRDVLEAEDGSLGLVMELLEGESLASRAARSKLTIEELASLAMTLCDAVHAAHERGVIHRDLKPENIFLVADGSVRVLDFGVAKVTSLDGDTARSAGTKTGTLLGTPLFMSPEQVFGEKNIDGATDVWSLGLMLYELLSGMLPTEGENLGQTLKIIVTRNIPLLESVAPTAPVELCRVIDQMLSLAREDRPKLPAVREVFRSFTTSNTDTSLRPRVPVTRSKVRILNPPETRFLENDGNSIAYQVFGEGLFHLVFIPGVLSNLEVFWEHPDSARFFSMMGSFARVIVIDKRGSGMSERLPGDRAPSLEERVSDVRAVLDALNVPKCVVLGVSEGGPMSISFAATHPERTMGLVLFGTRARFKPTEFFSAMLSLVQTEWGKGAFSTFLAGVTPDEQTLRWLARLERLTATPRTVTALLELLFTMDVVSLLPKVQAPTLILRRIDDPVATEGATKQFLSGIKDAELIEYPGGHIPIIGDYDTLLADVERFLLRRVLPTTDTIGAL